MKNKPNRICLIIGLVLGALADLWLRLTTGDEGNLLVHSVVFLGGGLIAAGVAYGLTSLWQHFWKTK